jgi:hypothetical protein
VDGGPTSEHAPEYITPTKYTPLSGSKLKELVGKVQVEGWYLYRGHQKQIGKRINSL